MKIDNRRLPTSWIIILTICLIIAEGLLSHVIRAQQNRELRQPEPSQRSELERRHALVIGNGAYTNSPLTNPPNDAQDMANTLRSLGFQVSVGIDQNQPEMKKQIRAFGVTLRSEGGIGLFYFAGHGVQLEGRNYLIPVGTAISNEADVEDEAVDLSFLLEQMRYAGNDLNIIILDACRNNPLARRFRDGRTGLAQVLAPRGMLIAYSTAPETVASDGTGRNGLYTAELLEQMKISGLPIEQMFKQVRIRVLQKSGGQQVPWESSSLFKDFFFSPSNAVISKRSINEEKAIPLIPVGTTIPSNKFRVFAFDTLTLDDNGHEISRKRLEARSYLEDLGGGVSLAMVEVPSGDFVMGLSTQERQVFKSDRISYGGYNEDVEIPQHRVNVEPFFMGKFEVTQKQWRAVAALPRVSKRLKRNPSHFKGDDLPVDSVSWADAIEFCTRLSKKTGRQYRLPSEAEWEYAARANTTSLFVSGNTITATIGNCCSEDPSMTLSVGSTGIANAFGLYDTQGNVQEWCLDVWHPNYAGAPTDGTAWLTGGEQTKRVLRGCCWANPFYMCRSAMRFNDSADDSIFGQSRISTPDLMNVRWNHTPDSGPSPEDYGFRVVVSAQTK